MTRVYIAEHVDPPKNYHSEPDCPTAQALKPVRESELPDKASPCSHCAGGISAEKLRPKYGEKA